MQETTEQQEQDELENRYEIEYCKTIDEPDAMMLAKSRLTIDATVEALDQELYASKRYNGLIPLSDEEWARIPQTAKPMLEELASVPGSFDERAHNPGCVSYEIQDQGTCGS